jgi:hypothetical protein
VVVLYTLIWELTQICLRKWTNTKLKEQYPWNITKLSLPDEITVELMKDASVLEDNTCVHNVSADFVLIRFPTKMFYNFMKQIDKCPEYESHLQFLCTRVVSLKKDRLPPFINIEKWEKSIGGGIFYQSKKKRRRE